MGIWLIMGLAPLVFGGDGGLTNTPTPAVVPEPALPQVTVPKPAPVNIPSAMAVSTEPAATAFRAQPVTLPTAQSLLLKTTQSSPTGPQSRLANIVAPPPPSVLSNTVSAAAAVTSATNAPEGQTDIWHKNTPALEGVNYHW